MIEHTLEKLRSDASVIIQEALAAVDPYAAVRNKVSLEGDLLSVNGFTVDLSAVTSITIIGAGKGSAPMAAALEDALGERLNGGTICVKYGHALPLKKIAVREAAHPVPDEAGLSASEEVLSILDNLRETDLVISCMSGGGSALLPAPSEGISLKQKQKFTDSLLKVGADIREMNTLRKHLSRVKGGGLLRAAYPAFVINLMLSDVIGDDPGTIASGPFAADPTTYSDCFSILDKYGISEKDHPEIFRHLRDGLNGKFPETVKPSEKILSRVTDVIVGSNLSCLLAAKKKAQALGYNALILSSSVQGDTEQAAMFHASIADEVAVSGNPVNRPACLLSGGETVVEVTGDGKGGRNQEFVLHLAGIAADIPRSVFVSLGTDGTDGPTDAAGAVVDSTTLERAHRMGLNLEAFLKENDSYHFFEQLGDLIITGPTRTNVMDIHIMLLR